MEESWKQIQGYDGYEVSNLGRVRKTTYLKPGKNRGKYLCVSLSKNNKAKTCTIHRLVANAFIPNPENKPEVNHKKGLKHDNRASELEWVTKLENMAHSKENKFQIKRREQRGELNSTNKLLTEEAKEILLKYKSGKYTMAQLAKEYLVSVSNISHITTGKYWTHLAESQCIKINRKNTRVLVLDTQTGIFYESISKAAFSRGIPLQTLVSYLNGKAPNKTSFIKV